MADKPVTREEKYLAYLTGDYTGEIPKPITRKEKYLYELCLKGMGGKISPEEIKAAVSEYLEKNPVKPGATTEQAQQIEQNKKDVDSLKEDISTKITKFYASSQGKTYLADSDNGKIMDMMLHGKSEQFTTTGKNLLKIRDRVQITRGITVTAKDGVVALKGTATEKGWAVLDVDSFVLDGTCILSSNISTDVKIAVSNKSFITVLEQGKSATLENAEVSKVCFVIAEGKTYDISDILVQIEKGSVATSYEPYTGGQPSPSPDYPQEIKSVVNPIVKLSNEDGTQFKTVTLPYTLNAIPVSSGGNVTIDGQQYIADYVDVERGKLVRMCKEVDFTKVTPEGYNNVLVVSKETRYSYAQNNLKKIAQSATVKTGAGYITAVNLTSMETWDHDVIGIGAHGQGANGQYLSIRIPVDKYAKEYFASIGGCKGVFQIETPEEIDLTPEEIQSFKALATYYPVTNISVNSEQLDGYTVFNYPISMVNGWNYVKQQIGDTRDYIYDMDARTQDTDLQAAEAYVNSEYAVALTELEV